MRMSEKDVTRADLVLICPAATGLFFFPG